MVATRRRPVRHAIACVVAVGAVLAPAGAGIGDPLGDPTPPPFGPFTGGAVADLPADWPTPPEVTATSWLVADLGTGQVLAARNADVDVSVASAVKVLTALSVLRRAGLEEVVTIDERAVGIEGASAGLVAGQVVDVARLLRLVVARSANDAATSLALHVAGSLPAFTRLMEQDAAALGIDVRVADVAGLDARTRMSARDLAVLAHHAMQDPVFRDLAATREVLRPDGIVEDTRNELLDDYPGATGIKTGFTSAAGGTLVASAGDDGGELLAVVLGSSDVVARFDDARALLDHARLAFERRTLAQSWTFGPVTDDAPGLELDVDVLAPGDVVVRALVGLPGDLAAADVRAVLGTPGGGAALGDVALVPRGAVPPPPTSLGAWLATRSQAALRAGGVPSGP